MSKTLKVDYCSECRYIGFDFNAVSFLEGNYICKMTEKVINKPIKGTHPDCPLPDSEDIEALKEKAWKYEELCK
jgi:hypothetical protein